MPLILRHADIAVICCVTHTPRDSAFAAAAATLLSPLFTHADIYAATISCYAAAIDIDDAPEP